MSPVDRVAQLRARLYAALTTAGPLVRYGVLNRWRDLDALEAEKIAAVVAPVLARATTPTDPAASGGDGPAALREWLDREIEAADIWSAHISGGGHADFGDRNVGLGRWTARAIALSEVRDRLATPAAPGAATEGLCPECRACVPMVLDEHRSDVEDPCGGTGGHPAYGVRTEPGAVLCTKRHGHDGGVHLAATPRPADEGAQGGRRTIRVTTTVPHVLAEAIRLVDRREGEDRFEAQARGLDEIGYAIVGKDDAGQLAASPQPAATEGEAADLIAPAHDIACVINDHFNRRGADPNGIDGDDAIALLDAAQAAIREHRCAAPTPSTAAGEGEVSS